MNTDNSKEDDSASVCANCGKEGNSDNMNTCNKCKMTKYCNAACKKKHRSKHKKHCERYLAELHDEKLFKQPPPNEDCPICFLRMPTLHTGRRYQTCCGKVICSGCVCAPVYDNQGNEVDNEKCPFCRTPHPDTDEEIVIREKKRFEVDDPIAIYNLGCDYANGLIGVTKDYKKALYLWHRAAKLGHAAAYNGIGYAYEFGQGVEVDMKKADYYYELAAIGGDAEARHNLGNNETRLDNMSRALKHYLIAARNGSSDSLDNIKDLYSRGHATKDDYTTALRLYQVYLSEIKSVQRDKAAAANDYDRYY